MLVFVALILSSFVNERVGAGSSATAVAACYVRDAIQLACRAADKQWSKKECLYSQQSCTRVASAERDMCIGDVLVVKL
jgi:hypothetical protein